MAVVLPEETVASVSTFNGCLDVMELNRPHWVVLENVESIERETDDSSCSVCI